MRVPQKRSWFFFAVSLGLAIAAVACILWISNRELRDFDPDWAAANIRVAAPIQAALERFRRDHGNYPLTLSELVPGYLATIPAASASHRVRPANDRWHYSREPDGQYMLCALAMPWVSSFDALIYSRSQHYQAACFRKCDFIEMDDWIYVVGFNRDLFRTSD